VARELMKTEVLQPAAKYISYERDIRA